MVRGFYRSNFWTPLRLEEVQSQDVARTLFDFAVNAGTGTAAKLAQIVVGTTPDGKIPLPRFRTGLPHALLALGVAPAMRPVVRHTELVQWL